MAATAPSRPDRQRQTARFLGGAVERSATRTADRLAVTNVPAWLQAAPECQLRVESRRDPAELHRTAGGSVVGSRSPAIRNHRIAGVEGSAAASATGLVRAAGAGTALRLRRAAEKGGRDTVLRVPRSGEVWAASPSGGVRHLEGPGTPALASDSDPRPGPHPGHAHLPPV